MTTMDLDLDLALNRIAHGDFLPPQAVLAVAGSPDILSAGMLADGHRRAVQGTRVTFLRVTVRGPADAIPWEPAAREVRIEGAVAGFDEARRVLASAREAASGRPVSAFTWGDVERWAVNGRSVVAVLRALRSEGLSALAQVALDAVPTIDAPLSALAEADFERVRLHVAKPGPAEERTRLWLEVARAQRDYGVVASLSPLPQALSSFRPTTGYDDVKTVALARLAASNVPHIQVDWRRYGPKLAQVALTFGADDVDGISASDDAPEGRRRAPLEEIRRNIEAAGFEPAERDGSFALVP